MLRATLREDVVAERLRRFPVKDTVLLEDAEDISVEDLRPLIAVVAHGIASRHDMRELCRHTRVGELLCDDSLLPSLLLERNDILVEGLLLGVVCHVEEPEAYLPQARRRRVVVTAGHNLVDELVGHRLAGLVVEGERMQELLLHGIVLHELRRHLYEVPPYICSRQTLEACVGEDAVEGMPELMKESLYLTETQQCRLVGGRLGEVHDQRRVRTDISAVLLYPLSLVFRHPRAVLLALTRIEVDVQQCEIFPVVVVDLEGLHVGIIYRYILVFLECYAVEPCCQTEDTLYDVVDLEIRAQHLRVEVVLLQLQLMRIERAIPRHHLEVAAFHFLCQCLHGLLLLQCRWLVSVDKVVEELVDIADVRGHTVLHDEVGVGFVSQQLCHLPSQVYQPLADLQVVVLIVVRTLCGPCHKHLLPQVALCGIHHERPIAWGVEGEEPSVLSRFLRRVTGSVADRLRQSVEFFLVGDKQREGLVLLQQVLRECKAELAGLLGESP